MSSAALLTIEQTQPRTTARAERIAAVLLATVTVVSVSSIKDILPIRPVAGAIHLQDLVKAAVFLAAGTFGLLRLPQTLKAVSAWPAWLGWAFGSLSLLTVILAANPRFALLGSGLLACLILFLPAALSLLGKTRLLTILLKSLSLFLIASTIVYLIFPSHQLFSESESNRLAGLTHSNGMGQMAGLMVIAALCLHDQGQLTTRQLTKYLVLSLVVFVWAQSRMPMVATILASACYLWRKGTVSQAAIFRSLILVGCGGLMLSSAIFVWESLPKRPGGKDQSILTRSGDKEELATLTGRDVIWAYSLKKIANKPLIGYGYGGSYLVYTAAYKNGDLLLNYGSAHNVVLETALNAGWLGAGILVLSLLGLWGLAFVRPALMPDLTVIFLTAVGITEPVLFGPIPGPATMFWFLALHWRAMGISSAIITGVAVRLASVARGSCREDVPMLKVLLVHNYYQQAGGEDQVVADETVLLESQGCEVVRYQRHNDEVRSQGALKTAAATIWNRRTYREVAALIRRERPDVMHCHNLFPLISTSAWKAAKDAHLPVVQTLHNFRWMCAGGAFLRDGKPCEDCLGRLPLAALRHACYRGSCAGTAVVTAMQVANRWRGALGWVDHFIALSEFSRGKFIAGGLPAERVFVKPNFITADVTPGEGRGEYALFVGRLSEEKGIGVLLKAWQALRSPIPLHFIGDGPLAEQVQAAANGDSRIQWLGRRAQPDVYAALGAARFLVLPSICYENFPKTLVEAYAHGTPVIAAGHGSLTELIDEGRTGFTFRAGDGTALAQAVERFPEDTDELARLRSGARERYESAFTAERNWERLLEIYRAAGGRRPASAPREQAVNFAFPQLAARQESY